MRSTLVSILLTFFFTHIIFAEVKIKNVEEYKTQYFLSTFCHGEADLSTSANFFTKDCRGFFLSKEKVSCVSQKLNLACPPKTFRYIVATDKLCLLKELKSMNLPKDLDLKNIKLLCQQIKTH